MKLPKISLNKDTLMIGLLAAAAAFFLLKKGGLDKSVPAVGAAAVNTFKGWLGLTGEDYGIKWTSTSSGLNGTRPWAGWYSAAFGGTPKPGYGRVTHKGAYKTERDRGSGGRWYPPAGFKLRYAGTLQGSVRGDARALVILARLCEIADLGELSHLGMYVWQGGVGDVTHDYGYAIDITDSPKYTKKEVMDRLIEAARSINAPIAWISSQQDGNIWPMYQLRNGSITRFSFSRQNHHSHYHLVLPRPNFALNGVERLP